MRIEERPGLLHGIGVAGRRSSRLGAMGHAPGQPENDQRRKEETKVHRRSHKTPPCQTWTNRHRPIGGRNCCVPWNKRYLWEHGTRLAAHVATAGAMPVPGQTSHASQFVHIASFK